MLCERPELDAGRDLHNHLTAAIGPHPRMRDFIDAMTLLSLEPEDVLIRAGEDADDVYFVADGRVRVQLTLPNGRVLRLRTMTGGAIVGEIALYRHQKRTADVIVETPSEIFRLSATELRAPRARGQRTCHSGASPARHQPGREIERYQPDDPAFAPLGAPE